MCPFGPMVADTRIAQAEHEIFERRRVVIDYELEICVRLAEDARDCVMQPVTAPRPHDDRDRRRVAAHQPITCRARRPSSAWAAASSAEEAARQCASRRLARSTSAARLIPP